MSQYLTFWGISFFYCINIQNINSLLPYQSSSYIFIVGGLVYFKVVVVFL
jgi:hypothetical protein